MSSEENFDDESFGKKVGRFAKSMGAKAVEMALTLRNCLFDPETPAWAKSVIFGALAYLIFPADAVPDIVPGAGLADDGAALAAAMATVAAHIKEQHIREAREMMKRFFG